MGMLSRLPTTTFMYNFAIGWGKWFPRRQPKPIRTIKVQGLAEVYDGAEVPSEVACKAMAPYAFTSSFELEPQDILRVRRKDPSKKN